MPLARVPLLLPVFMLQRAEIIKNWRYREIYVPGLRAVEFEVIKDLKVPGSLLLDLSLVHVGLRFCRDLPDLGVKIDILGLIKQTPLLVQLVL